MRHSLAISERPGSHLTRGSLPQLDSLRAIALLLVLAGAGSGGGDLLGFAAPVGLSLFFVTSGFLVTTTLQRCRRYVERGHQTVPFTLRRFYIRRALRLLPIYYVVLAAAWISGAAHREGAPWQLALLSNIHVALSGSWHLPLGQLWAVAAAAQFFILWSALVLLLPASALVPAAAALVLAAPLFRIAGTAAGLSDIALWTLPVGTFDALAFGALVALTCRAGTPPRLRDRPWLVLAAWAAAAVLVLPVVVQPVWPAVATAFQRLQLASTALAALLAWVLLRTAIGWRGRTGQIMQAVPLVRLGRLSYATFLLAPLVPLWTTRVAPAAGLQLPAGGWVRALLDAGAAIALAAIAAWLIDRPAREWQARYGYRARQPRGLVPRVLQRTPHAERVSALQGAGVGPPPERVAAAVTRMRGRERHER